MTLPDNLWMKKSKKSFGFKFSSYPNADQYTRTSHIINIIDGMFKGKPNIKGGNVDWYMGYDKALEELKKRISG